MIYPSGDAIKERIQNRYSLVVVAAKRAKQLKEGAPPLIDTLSQNPLTIALEEIAAGKIGFIEGVEAPDEEYISSVNTRPELVVALEQALDSGYDVPEDVDDSAAASLEGQTLGTDDANLSDADD